MNNKVLKKTLKSTYLSQSIESIIDLIKDDVESYKNQDFLLGDEFIGNISYVIDEIIFELYELYNSYIYSDIYSRYRKSFGWYLKNLAFDRCFCSKEYIKCALSYINVLKGRSIEDHVFNTTCFILEVLKTNNNKNIDKIIYLLEDMGVINKNINK